MADIFDGRLVSPMLISERREPFDSPDHIFELKMDGERCIAYLDPLIGKILSVIRLIALSEIGPKGKEYQL